MNVHALCIYYVQCATLGVLKHAHCRKKQVPLLPYNMHGAARAGAQKERNEPIAASHPLNKETAA